jgi:2-polyprenyl-6-methoxyphenol hydroxylase-like FAD-dependent oxidoreductase
MLTSYDAIIVGGGLAGSGLADQLAHVGYDVLVLERESQFRDRVRGENVLSWGVAAARRLGIYNTLIAAGGRPSPNWIVYVMGQPAPTRDLRTTTPGSDPMLNILHPDMQEAMIARARDAGAVVQRCATVLGVDAGPGRSPSVTYELDGTQQTATARIVVGADGRASQMRSWGGFEVQQDPDFLVVAGMLIRESDVPEGGAYLCMGPGVETFWVPLGAGRARTYFAYPGVAGRRGLSGKNKIGEYFQALRSLGTPESWLARAESIGPLAEFEGAARWVTSPARNGVVLIGDAAGASDPSWGSGLALTLLDIECLATALRSNDNWDAALEQYARGHDDYHDAIHRIHAWMTELAWSPGPEADERRARVLPKWLTQAEGLPDLVGLGPFGPSDERARRLMLGLD